MDRGKLIRVIEEAWEESDQLRHGSLNLKAEWNGSRIVLTGYVRSNTLKAMAGALARYATDDKIPLENRTISDEEIEVAAAQKMAETPETKEMVTRVRIESYLGEVTLHTVELSEGEVQKAISAVHDMPGVRKVHTEAATTHVIGA